MSDEITPERVLYYLENLCLLMCEAPNKQEDIEQFYHEVYVFSHVGTKRLHVCQHPDWEQEFLKAEQSLIDSGFMKPYHQRVSCVMSKIADPLNSPLPPSKARPAEEDIPF